VLEFNIVTQPTNGSVGFYSPDDIYIKDYSNGRFTYTPHPSAIGTDSFTFTATDTLTGAVSNTAVISIFINPSPDPLAGPISNDIIIEVVNVESGASVSPITVISDDALSAEIADVDFSYPVGIFFFSVKDVPINIIGDSTVTISMTLPLGTSFLSGPDNGLKVRKLDKFGRWITLRSTSAGGRLGFDGNYTDPVTGQTVMKLSMILTDNDDFDNDPTIGVINDPIAIGIKKEPAQSPNNSQVNNPQIGAEKNNKPLETSKGAGTLFYFACVIFLILFLLRMHQKHTCYKYS